MALINCNFRSEALQINTEITVILPHQEMEEYGELRVLYLLHGLAGDHTAWMRETSIERYVKELGIAVVMPAVNRSFYADMHYGAAYWTFISEELPALVRRLFRISAHREHNFVAGLSMGGYGAFKLALRHPGRFAAAASLSGAMDIAARKEELPVEYTLIYGDYEADMPADDDLFRLIKQAKDEGTELPRLYQCCGTEDFLYEDNIRFRDFTRQLGVSLQYEEEPGEHNWAYWDMKIQDVLNWMFKPN